MSCNCGGRKRGETYVWTVTCDNTDPKDYLTELEARAALSVCQGHGQRGTYKRNRKQKAGAKA